MSTDDGEAMTALPFAVPAGEGSRFPLPNATGTVTVKAGTAPTGGALTILEFEIAAGAGPGMHAHHREDELWYVLDGQFRFQAADAKFRLSTGGMAFGPRGTPHAFQNIGDSPGRLLVITTPAGIESFFERAADLPPGPVDPSALAARAAQSGIEFLGPPLAVSDPL
jgi:quercetin dioxygenase-like cupin family protein